RGKESIPLSFSQQRLWFIEQFEPGNTMYNCPIAARLVGDLDVDALQRTISEIVRRHEILRTAFITGDGLPAQVVLPAEPVKLEVIDLSQLPGDRRAERAQQLINEELRRPFDLSIPPLLRATLIRSEPQEHLLLFMLHHIVSDAWSMGVLINEVRVLYTAFRDGRPQPLEELPIQYADYAIWQREWLSGEVLEKLVDYWKAQLGDESRLLELPTDRPRLAKRSFKSASQSLT